MLSKIILLLAILAYSIIVAQSFMYIVALKNVQKTMAAGSYIELRNLLDKSFRANYKYAVYSALITSLLHAAVNIKSPDNLLFITAVIAFIALAADVLLMMKGNMPINNLINTWTAEKYPANWAEYRAKWLQVFFYREIVTIIGFVSLVFGSVLG